MIWPQTLQQNHGLNHQHRDLAADIPKYREDNKTTQHQNCDLAADITKQSTLKPSNLQFGCRHSQKLRR